LEGKSSRTKAEESLLASKKQELAKLLAEKNKSNITTKPKDKTALYIGMGIVGVVLVGLVVILVRKGKFSRFLFRQSKDKKKRKY